MRARHGCLAFSLIVVFAANSPAADAALDRSHAGFCAEVQRLLVPTALPVGNALQRSKDSFKTSKAAVSPLGTQQFVEVAADGRPRAVSCKTKTADHLRAVHGIAAAPGPVESPRSCRDVQRAVVLQVWAALDAEQRADAAYAPARILLAADTLSYTGSAWLSTPAAAWVGSDGRLRMRASALYAAWEDWRWKVMPQSFRGNHYCHLVAPERIRGLMLGEERADPQSPAAEG